MHIDVVVSFKVEETRVAAFRQLMHSVKTSLPTVSGCLGARIFQGIDDASLFTLVERWESRERHSAHIAQLVASGQWAQILDYLAAEPVATYVAEL